MYTELDFTFFTMLIHIEDYLRTKKNWILEKGHFEEVELNFWSIQSMKKKSWYDKQFISINESNPLKKF